MPILDIYDDFFIRKNFSLDEIPSKKTIIFKTYSDFYNFINKEKTFWSDCIAGDISQIYSFFYGLCNKLEMLENMQSKDAGITQIENIMYELSTQDINKIVYSNTPEAIFLKNLYLKNKIEADGAYNYLIRNNMQNINNYQSATGILHAYMFKNTDEQFNLKIEAEKQNLHQVNEDYSKKLDGLYSECSSEFNNLKTDFFSIQNSILEEKDALENTIENLVSDSTQKLQTAENLYQTKLVEMEKLYLEKLRLEAPACYWDNMHQEYLKNGEKWKKWSIWTSIFFIFFLCALLYMAPSELFEQYGLNSVKATIFIALIASIGIYIIRLLVTLSTSAYHLSRDAYERFQLTHVYLSLLKAEGIKDEDRAIVLQSLFSRADTGLLKKDSSPTFPKGSVESIIKNLFNK